MRCYLLSGAPQQLNDPEAPVGGLVEEGAEACRQYKRCYAEVSAVPAERAVKEVLVK